MSDFGTMVRRIRTDLNRGSAHDARIKESISDAIEYFASRRLGFNTQRKRTVLTPQVEYLAMPTDWIEVDHIRLEHDDEREPLTEVSYDWIEDEQRGIPSDGEPVRYAVHRRELRFYPRPDLSYTLVMTFLCHVGGVSVSASDAATNAWMTEGEKLIRTYALGDLYVHYIGGSEIQRGMALKAEAEEIILPVLERRAAREQTAGRLRPFL